MQKVQVVPSSQSGKFRVILNPSDIHSVGIIMEKSELNELFFLIKGILEQPDNVASAITPVDASV